MNAQPGGRRRPGLRRRPILSHAVPCGSFGCSRADVYRGGVSLSVTVNSYQLLAARAPARPPKRRTLGSGRASRPPSQYGTTRTAACGHSTRTSQTPRSTGAPRRAWARERRVGPGLTQHPTGPTPTGPLTPAAPVWRPPSGVSGPEGPLRPLPAGPSHRHVGHHPSAAVRPPPQPPGPFGLGDSDAAAPSLRQR